MCGLKNKGLDSWGRVVAIVILTAIVILWALKVSGILSMSVSTTSLVSASMVAAIGTIPVSIWLIMGLTRPLESAPKKFLSILFMVWILPVAVVWLLQQSSIILLSPFWLWLITLYPFALVLLACFIFGTVFMVVMLKQSFESKQS